MTRQNFILAALIFIALEIALVLFVDQSLSDYLRGIDADHHEWIDFFRSITDLAKSKWYLWPSGIGVIICALLLRLGSYTQTLRDQIRHLGKKLLFAFVAIAVSGIATDILKPIIGRARPMMLMRENFYGFHPFSFHAEWNSLPSGHATTAITVAALLTLFLPRWRCIWWALGIILCLSRVAVNAHFLSDIIAGGAIGYLAVRLLSAKDDVGRFTWNGKTSGPFHVERWIFPIDRTRT